MGNLVIGLDVGNGFIKATGENFNYVFPSGLVRAREKEKFSFNENRDLNIFKIKSLKNDSEEEYLLGENIGKLGDDIITTNVGEGRYSDKYYKLICEGVIAYIIKNHIPNAEKDKHTVKIVIGLPSREKVAKNLEEELIRAFEGNHIVAVDNLELTFEVKVLKVVAQPLGTLFNCILEKDKNGEFPNTSLTKQYIGIIDTGTGTTDIDGINQLTVVDSDRDTFNIGSYTITQELSDFINKENPYANSTFNKVEEQFNEENYKISERAFVRIKEEKEKVIKEKAEELANKILVRWQNTTKFDKIYLTGGSANIFAKYIRNIIKDVEIVKNPQLANAKGFYKYAILLLEQAGELDSIN